MQSAFLEPGQDAARVVSELAAKLRELGAWLALDGIEVAGRGDLSAPLGRCYSTTR